MKLNFLCAHLQWIPEYFVSSVSLHVKLKSESRVLHGGWDGDDQIVHFQQSFELPSGIDENLNILVDLVAVLNDAGTMTRTIGSGAIAMMPHNGLGHTRMIPLFSCDSDIIMAQLLISTNDGNLTRENMIQLFPRATKESSPAALDSSHQLRHAVGNRAKSISFSSSRISCLTPHSVQRWRSTAKESDHSQTHRDGIFDSSPLTTGELTRTSNPPSGVVRGDHHRIVRKNVVKEARSGSSGQTGKTTDDLYAPKSCLGNRCHHDGEDAHLTPISDSRTCGLWSIKGSSVYPAADTGVHVDRILRNGANIRNREALASGESFVSDINGVRNVTEHVSPSLKSHVRSHNDREKMELELDLESQPDSTCRLVDAKQMKRDSVLLTSNRIDKSCVLKANDAYCRVRDLLHEKDTLLQQAHSRIAVLSGREGERDKCHRNDVSSIHSTVAVSGGGAALETADVRSGRAGSSSSSSPLRDRHVHHEQAQSTASGRGLGGGVNRSLSVEGDVTDGDMDHDVDFNPPVIAGRKYVTGYDRRRRSDGSSGQRPNVVPTLTRCTEPLIEPFNRSTWSLSGCRGSESIDPILDMQMRLQSAERRRARILRNTKERAGLMAARARSKSLAIREAVLRSSLEFDEMRNRIDRQGDRDRLMRGRSRSATRPPKERSSSAVASNSTGMARSAWSSRGQGVEGRSGYAVGGGRRASSAPKGSGRAARSPSPSPSIPYSDLRLRSRSVHREGRGEKAHTREQNRYEMRSSAFVGTISSNSNYGNGDNSSNSTDEGGHYSASRAMRYETNKSVSSPLAKFPSSSFPPPSFPSSSFPSSSFSPNTTTEHSTSTSTLSGMKWSGKAFGREREEEKGSAPTRCFLRRGKVHTVPPIRSTNASTRTSPSPEDSSQESQNILLSLVLERIEDLQRGISTASQEEAHGMLKMIERLVPIAVAVNIIIKSSVGIGADAMGGNEDIDQIRKTYDAIAEDVSNSNSASHAIRRHVETETTTVVQPVSVSACSIPDPVQDPHHIQFTAAAHSNVEKQFIRNDSKMRDSGSRPAKHFKSDSRVTPSPSLAVALRENQTSVSPSVPIFLEDVRGSHSPPYAVKKMGDVDMCGSPFQGVRMYSESSSSSSSSSSQSSGHGQDNYTGCGRHPFRDADSSSRSKHPSDFHSDSDSTPPDIDKARLRYVHRSTDASHMNPNHHVGHCKSSRTPTGPADDRNTNIGVTLGRNIHTSSMWTVGEDEEEDEENIDEEEEDEGEGVEDLSVTSGGFSLDIAHVATAIDHLQVRTSSMYYVRT